MQVRLVRLVPVLVLLAGPGALSAQDDDAGWLRDCDRNYGSDKREHFCEIRHTGFKPSGTSLEIDPDVNGGVDVVGWDRDSISVATLVQASAMSEDDAKALAREVKTEISGGTIRVTGPSSGRRQSWSGVVILRVPRKMDIRAESTNGPLSVEGVTGTMDLRAQNGPVSLSGVAGDVRARVQNGPLSVTLSGSRWEGKGLDAESVNGPVDLAVPENYNAELETGTVNGPYDLAMPLTVTLKGNIRDRIHSTLGKGGAPVRVVTTNGPLTIRRARS